MTGVSERGTSAVRRLRYKVAMRESRFGNRPLSWTVSDRDRPRDPRLEHLDPRDLPPDLLAVMHGLLDGMKAPEIAAALGLTRQTVHRRIARIGRRATPPRICEATDCANTVPVEATSRRRYCSPTCGTRIRARKSRAAKESTQCRTAG
jgi:hypothetical protein